jgi:hypothetical protein
MHEYQSGGSRWPNRLVNTVLCGLSSLLPLQVMWGTAIWKNSSQSLEGASSGVALTTPQSAPQLRTQIRELSGIIERNRAERKLRVITRSQPQSVVMNLRSRLIS